MINHVVGTTTRTSYLLVFGCRREYDIFMKLTPIFFFRFPQNNLDSTQRSRKSDKIVANTLRSFFPPQIIAAATIDFLFSVSKALYISFQMHIS